MTTKPDLTAAMGRAKAAPVSAERRSAPDPMSAEARGGAPVWRTAPPVFGHSFTLPLDERRYEALHRLSFAERTSGAVLLRSLIDLVDNEPELLAKIRAGMVAETAALRRRSTK